MPWKYTSPDSTGVIRICEASFFNADSHSAMCGCMCRCHAVQLHCPAPMRKRPMRLAIFFNSYFVVSLMSDSRLLRNWQASDRQSSMHGKRILNECAPHPSAQTAEILVKDRQSCTFNFIRATYRSNCHATQSAPFSTPTWQRE